MAIVKFGNVPADMRQIDDYNIPDLARLMAFFNGFSVDSWKVLSTSATQLVIELEDSGGASLPVTLTGSLTMTGSFQVSKVAFEAAGVDVVLAGNVEVSLAGDVSGSIQSLTAVSSATSALLVSFAKLGIAVSSLPALVDADPPDAVILAGADSISGGSGGDWLLGYAGNDTVVGNGGNDNINGGVGNDVLLGGLGSDVLTGSSGSDRLVGGLGNDALNGGLGKDVFRFDTVASTLTNRDTITGFSVIDDTIQLENAVFTRVGLAGTLAAAAFWKSPTAVGAHDPTDRVIYNTTTGALYYDPDGTGPLAKVQFATLAGSPDGVTNADFVVT